MLRPTMEDLSLGRHKEIARISVCLRLERYQQTTDSIEDQLGELRSFFGAIYKTVSDS